MTGVFYSKDVDAVLKDVLVHNDGWKATGENIYEYISICTSPYIVQLILHQTRLGFPVKQPRTGWYAQKANAEFSLKVTASFETKYFTLMNMVSYGDNFKDSVLKVILHVNSGSSEEEQNVSEHSISGYHTTLTSIHIPTKIELPGGGAKEGDTILVEVKLLSGSYFKINGMALCTY